MAQRSVKRRGGGRVQGFLEEDTWEVIAIFKHFPRCVILLLFLGLSMDSHVL